jgi:hypothetical protein
LICSILHHVKIETANARNLLKQGNSQNSLTFFAESWFNSLLVKNLAACHWAAIELVRVARARRRRSMRLSDGLAADLRTRLLRPAAGVCVPVRRIADLGRTAAGGCCAYAMRNAMDDVGFTRAVIDDLSRRARIDSRRIYATGISNGGMMAYRLGVELAGRITAIAPVEAVLVVPTNGPSRPVPPIGVQQRR